MNDSTIEAKKQAVAEAKKAAVDAGNKTVVDAGNKTDIYIPTTVMAARYAALDASNKLDAANKEFADAVTKLVAGDLSFSEAVVVNAKREAAIAKIEAAVIRRLDISDVHEVPAASVAEANLLAAVLDLEVAEKEQKLNG